MLISTKDYSELEINIWEMVSFGLIILALILPIILHYIYFNSFSLLNIETQGKLGPISDWLNGIITPCIALASFILLYRTYYNQKEELRLTRVLTGQQKFETTFFNMLNLFDSYTKNIRYRLQTSQGLLEYSGQDYFRHMHFKIFASVCKSKENKDPTLLVSLEQNIGSSIEVLRCLLELIDITDEIDKKIFVNILKATISPEAKYAVNYYLSDSDIEDNKNLYSLVTKYDICDMAKKAKHAKKFNERMQSS